MHFRHCARGTSELDIPVSVMSWTIILKLLLAALYSHVCDCTVSVFIVIFACKLSMHSTSSVMDTMFSRPTPQLHTSEQHVQAVHVHGDRGTPLISQAACNEASGWLRAQTLLAEGVTAGCQAVGQGACNSGDWGLSEADNRLMLSGRWRSKTPNRAAILPQETPRSAAFVWPCTSDR